MNNLQWQREVLSGGGVWRLDPHAASMDKNIAVGFEVDRFFCSGASRRLYLIFDFKELAQ